MFSKNFVNTNFNTFDCTQHRIEPISAISVSDFLFTKPTEQFSIATIFNKHHQEQIVSTFLLQQKCIVQNFEVVNK